MPVRILCELTTGESYITDVDNISRYPKSRDSLYLQEEDGTCIKWQADGLACAAALESAMMHGFADLRTGSASVMVDCSHCDNAECKSFIP